MAARKNAGTGTRERIDMHEESIREDFWRSAKRVANNLPFMEELVAAYYCALDRDTPWRVRGILFGALAYFILPADMVPDILLGFGFTDDIAVLTAAITSVSANIKPAHRKAAKKALAQQ